MKKRTRKLALKKNTIRSLDKAKLEQVDGAGVDRRGYGFTCNRNNCGHSGDV